MADVSHVFEFYNISEGEAYIEFLLYLVYQLHVGQWIPSFHILGGGLIVKYNVLSFQYLPKDEAHFIQNSLCFLCEV